MSRTLSGLLAVVVATASVTYVLVKEPAVLDDAPAAASDEIPAPAGWTDLEATIIAAEPDALADDPLVRAAALHRWASVHIDFANDAQSIAHRFEVRPPESAWFDVLEPDAGGVLCGGASVFLANIMKRFGIPAFTLDFGVNGTTFTHVTVVVPHEDDFYIFDPTFGATFWKEGERARVRDMLEGQVEMRELDLSEREFIGSRPYPHFCRDGLAVAAGERFICTMAAERYFDHYLLNHKQLAAEHGLVADRSLFPAMLKKGVFTIGSENAKTESAFKALLRDHGVPLHRETAEG